jgi:hypothetical protein
VLSKTKQNDAIFRPGLCADLCLNGQAVEPIGDWEFWKAIQPCLDLELQKALKKIEFALNFYGKSCLSQHLINQSPEEDIQLVLYFVRVSKIFHFCLYEKTTRYVCAMLRK